MIDLPASFRPTTGTQEQWNAAYVRVEDYLRAHRIHNRLHQVTLIQRVLERAAARHAAQPTLDPTVLAAEEIEGMIDRWFADLLAENGEPHERIAVDGRVALLLSDAPQKWPNAFLAGDVPDDFKKALRASSMRAGPDMSLSSMVPRPIDLGAIPSAAGETLERFARWPIIPTLILWLLFAGGLILIFRLVHSMPELPG